MFWSSPASQSTIDDLLDQEDLTIQKLLDDDNVLQKCHEKDPRLTEFLCRIENVEYLVKQITDPPNSDEFDSDLYRHSSLACEIMTCDIGSLSDRLIQTELTSVADRNGRATTDKCNAGTSPNQSLSNNDVNSSSEASVTASSIANPPVSATQRRPLLDRFFTTLQAPLNPLSASFLCRILVHLSVHRGPVVIPYMRAFPNFLECLLSHFHLSVLPDVLIQLAQQERGLQKSVFEWFREDCLVSRLIQLFSATNSSEVHESAAHCLVQLIITLRNYLHNNAASNREANTSIDIGLPPNSPYAMLVDDDEATYTAAVRLLDVMESEDSMDAILNHLTNETTVTTSVAVNCIDVLVTVMDKRRPETGFAPSEGAPVMDLDQLLAGTGNPHQSGSGRSVRATIGGDNEPEGGQPASTVKLRVAQSCSTLAKACLPRLHHLHALLQRPHSQTCNHMATTFGPLDPPLGSFRLTLAQFLTLLVALPLDTGIAEGLAKEGVVKTLMDLFEQYPFNTLLHQTVTEFLLLLFSHIRVIVSKRTDQKEGPRASPSQASTEARSENSTVEDNRMDIDSQSTHCNQAMDDAFVTIVTDYCITDWCLRLFKAFEDLSCHPENGSNLANKHVPKPGYTGHLWKLANAIEEARNGPRRDFVRAVFQNLSPNSLSSWEQFVSDDLAKINAQQAADDVLIENPEQKNSALRIFIQQNVNSWLSQSSSLVNLSSGVSGSGKFSLFLGPLAFGTSGGSSGGIVCSTTSDNPLGLNVRSAFSANAGDADDLYLEPTDPSSSLWINTDDASEPNAASVLNSAIELEDPRNLTALSSDGFRRARIASLSSDESDDDLRPGLDINDSDEDEEEDLHSPMVIKQQRSGATPTEPIIASTNPACPWGYGHSAAAMADVSTDNLYAWANFDDDPPKASYASDQPTDRDTCDHPPSPLNGSSNKGQCSTAPVCTTVDTNFASENVNQHGSPRKSLP